jgi:nucleoside-diphosphate-sugar epimerase
VTSKASYIMTHCVSDSFETLSMPRILVTGASGYIGRRVCEMATKRGLDVVVLGNAPPIKTLTGKFSWRLGENPAQDAFSGVIAVIHLGHSWISDAAQGATPMNTNIAGSEKLARTTLAAGVARFVLASTVSARPQALNAYGRIKHALEERVLGLPNAEGRVACARIGLVYGGREEGMFGLLSKLVRITPILPMVGLDRQVQPIYIDEVVEGLLALAMNPLPRRNGTSTAIYVLAGPNPCAFGDWLRLLRRMHTGKRLILLPVPMWVALLACNMTRLVPFVPTINRERVLGLAGTAPIDSAADLEALHVKVACPRQRFQKMRAERRRLAAEAAAMLSYVSGSRISSKAAVARLISGIDRQGAQSLGLPDLVIKYPALLRVFDPLSSRSEHRLAQRLHLAVMVMESMPREGLRHPRVLSLLGQAMVEAVALPLRVILGNCYA